MKKSYFDVMNFHANRIDFHIYFTLRIHTIQPFHVELSYIEAININQIEYSTPLIIKTNLIMFKKHFEKCFS